MNNWMLMASLFGIVTVAVFGFLSNKYARKQARAIEELMIKRQEADEYSQLLLDATPMICHLWNENYRIVNCNLETLKLFGLERKEDFYDKCIENLSPEYQPDGQPSRQKAVALVQKAFHEGYNRAEWTYQLSDGEPLPCEMTLVRVKHRNGYLVAGYARDLREHKENLTEIYNTHESLRIARDAAEASSQAKSTFLANMSHEIRTPMNSIIGFSELAQDGDIPLKTKQYLAKISENASWLLSIINDILDISKIESGKISFEQTPFSLHDLFTSCQALIVRKAEEKGLNLFCYAESSINKTLLGDPVRLRQALVNILSNAVKFTASGTVKFLASIVNIETIEKVSSAENEKRATVRFEIEDTGIGMTPEQIERIFQPFMQADDSITRKYGGTGLGLPLTKNIVEMMGGRLEVESEYGVGSKFSFDLTFDIVNEPADTPAHENILNDLEKPSFEGEILICEDNNMNQQVICEHLARVGLNTVVANNGKEGVDMVLSRINNNEKPFDLIFMDIHMPVMDGLEASSRITASGVKTPIVVMTANIMVNELDIYKSHGIIDYVSKPFTSRELWKCLFKYFRTSGIPKIETDENIQNNTDEINFLNKLRINFVRSNQTICADIRKAVNDGDITLAHRLAHTLKSNAGQIKEKLLQEAAAAVEDILREETHFIAEAEKDKINFLETELRSVLERLAPMFAKIETEIEIDTADKSIPIRTYREELSRLIEKLEPMLKKRNPECVNLIENLRNLPGTETLARQIEEYDFKSAGITLNELKMSKRM